ncbi:MAG: LysR family transcriptional regulator [Hoeflea sp.]|uniref:hydrogen peroxide-inducible genes activator n=1 Tax=Hoeflea sp. TaxID=1940281 RepID=UPI001D2C4B51|nr:hydrogen peroxide-inducible genes activator [Hoeflea sp.]MBU4531423.1 LysR family transcriptional regulator [Alphaproteobacteria bacterium]MBU4544280.1 LysR family transcriptional regulator [Alphaproteobacteria bacterium]MBU4550483.1 LysR family transcriptional regulator [Alphaproteobacteria bacterium]MBV1724699.1 LysR family transcriptional regulator [Hoeflea sp.]MBV1760719.1 LysR family transcriptional regulator [Hoeflea sp.]
MTLAITLRQLGFLVAVADELNFSRAAEACYVTQPTMSAGIKELEARLGVVLIERTKRSVLLTPLGHEIVLRARALLLDAGEIEKLARSGANPEEGDLRLGAIPTIGPFLIPKALPVIRRAFPKLRLYLREAMTEHLLEKLHAGRLDLVLFAQPFDASGLETLHLFDDGYHLAAQVGTLDQRPVKGTELQGVRLMLLEKGHCLQRHALKAFPDLDIEQDDTFAASSLATLISMVSEGLGITLLPDLSIDAGMLAGQDVAITPLPDACPRHVTLAWRPSTTRRKLFVEIGEILQATREALRPLADSARAS